MTPTQAKPKLTMEQRFETLEKRIVNVMTLGIGAMAVVVTLLGIFIAVIAANQNKQAERLSELSELFVEDKQQLQSVREDFGTMLMIYPLEHKVGYEWIIDELTQKYNPKRGGGKPSKN